jgi:hypothetical protein
MEMVLSRSEGADCKSEVVSPTYGFHAPTAKQGRASRLEDLERCFYTFLKRFAEMLILGLLIQMGDLLKEALH